MSDQLIISISREFGSGGHIIAEELAKRFELPLLDKSLLKTIAEEKDMDHKKLEKYDEVPRNRLLTRTVKGHSSSPEEHIANMQFAYLKERAAKGDSFVVVGRCAETVLKGFSCMIPIFVNADHDSKLEKTMREEGMSRREAEVYMVRKNKMRKNYHNYYSEVKWGDSRNYDLTVNTSRLGIDRTADFLETYIRMRWQG
ncbi:MAG: cytidylate kinase-like family protein [Clostridiales bacterium]|nr:cytidylate kinase-like family protein [Clostridiales bacterium]